MWRWFHRLGSPPGFYAFADRLAPWLLWLSLAGIAVSWGFGLFVVPPDYQQGDSFRIIYVHVPAAWLSLMAYTVMAIAGLIALVWRMKLAECAVMACAPVGASFTALALAPVIGGGPVLMLVGATRLFELVAELGYAAFARWRWSAYVEDHPDAADEDDMRVALADPG